MQGRTQEGGGGEYAVIPLGGSGPLRSEVPKLGSKFQRDQLKYRIK